MFARAWGGELVSIAQVIEESDLHDMLKGKFGPTVQLRDDLMSVYIMNRDKVGLFSAAAARATVKAYAHFFTILEQQKHLNKFAR